MFDPNDDIAVLRVPQLGLPALSLAQEPGSGTSGAILGYPENGPFDAAAARIGHTQSVLTQNAYGQGPISAAADAAARPRAPRQLRRARSSTPPGSVLTTVFASTVGCHTHGGYGVANETVSGRAVQGRGARTARSRPGRARRVNAVAQGCASGAPATLTAMSKTLLVAEKPSVGQDLARVLKGPFKKQEGSLEGPDHVITWAVGHLVQLAEPEAYDAKYKSWRMADLPIVPDRFKLIVRDERSRKQMSVVTKQLRREDIDEVVNACDAGREGELIFAYLYEKAKANKPVKRLWLNSMTNAAMKDALASLRPGEEFEPPRGGCALALGGRLDRRHERDPRGDDPPAQLLRRRRLARARPDADAGDRRPARGGDQGLQAGALLARRRDLRGRRPLQGERRRAHLRRALPHARRRSPGARKARRIATEQEAQAIVAACEGRPGTITKLEKKEQREKAPMLYDLTTLQREANNRYGFSAKRTLGAAQRLYEEHKALTYPRTNSRYLPTDMVDEIKPIAELVGTHPDYRAGAQYVTGLDVLPLGRVVNDEKVTDHHAIIPTRSEHNLEKMSSDDRRIYDMATRRFLAVFHPEAVFENTRIETTVTPAEDAGGHVFRTSGKLLLVPGWRGVYDEVAADAKAEPDAPGDEDEAERAAAAAPVRGRGRSRPARSRAFARKRNRPAATATPPCWARWRPPASS